MNPALSIAHTGEPRRGRKLTPLFQGFNAKGWNEKRRTAVTVPTLPTLPGGLAERGRKSTPPFAEPHVRVGRAGTLGVVA